MLKEFKEFAFKGNVIDLAVGVVVGAAFSKIVSGTVDDLVMPLVSLLLPDGDWRATVVHVGHAELKVGHLIGVVIDFLLVSLVLFLAINKLIQRMRSPASPITRECPACAELIALKARRCKFCTEVLVLERP